MSNEEQTNNEERASNSDCYIVAECFECGNPVELEKASWIHHITIGSHILCDNCAKKNTEGESISKKVFHSRNELLQEMADTIELLAIENEIVSWLQFACDYRIADKELSRQTTRAIQLHKSKAILLKGRIDALEILRDTQNTVYVHATKNKQ